MKALIVDDEVGIIEMIKRTTPWNDLGISELYTANEGQTALKIIHDSAPDIVITDIEMPIMDGVEFVERLAAEGLHPEIIFLTCHADFEYARRAMRSGVSDYLLKPFRPEELAAILSTAVVRCGEKRHLPVGDGERPASGEMEHLKRSFLRDVLDYSFGSDEQGLRKEMEERGLKFSLDTGYRLIAVGMDVEEVLQKYTRPEFLFIFRNIALEVIFGLERTSDAFFVEYFEHGRLIAYTAVDGGHFAKLNCEEKCTRLAGVLKQYLKLTVTCVISEEIFLGEFAQKRDQIDSVLAYSISGGSGILFLDEQGAQSADTAGKINQQEIARFLREQKKCDLFMYVKHFLEQRERQLNAQEMKLLHRDLMQVFYGYLYENHISANDFFQDEMSRKIEEAAEYSSINMLKYISFMYDGIMRHIEEAKKSASVVEVAKRFINMNFSEDIGRTEVAEHVLLAPNYLSMLFHRETGQTIREYINQCRIDEAKRLMSTTNNSVTDIALQVGFNNISYFSTTFKKYTDLSPVEYRHQLESEGRGV